MSDLPDNVVAIETRFHEAAPVEVQPRDYGACRHEHTTLDPVLRVVSCRDCGEERLDPFEVLTNLAYKWNRWHREAEQLRKLNEEYATNELAKFERARDRHLHANRTHAASFNRQIAALGDPDRTFFGNSTNDFACRTCWTIFLRYDRRWVVRRAPEPPPGPLGGTGH